ncbi:hypothetical protein GCM10011391_27120 [Pullulanibacillus camelliae]|uniref:5-formyltetrahydrofolate cyclo-ligase n=1 Tax=Pullulanibacillus camelliae TaxID=1707096 RepID=A0A8J2YIZ8_9BACL|nr:5-formyltetrahydrofolate cyclo-ligase [Pullulanibacillus camelliae]GGE46843.1 hypothetical protein GCM10011391_27120 [Pullulanibacillus camelliae]
MLSKKELRKNMKRCLQEITNLDIEASKIHQQIYQQSWWQQAETVAVTVSTVNELDTTALIEAAWQSHKRVVIPKCFPEERRLDFREITRWDQVEKSFYNLHEPKLALTMSVPKKEMDLIIVPGLAFDPRGYRIGFGGGYYDRFLASCSAVKVAQAVDCQVCNQVPAESHDIAVDMIVTPSEVMKCSV